MNKSTFKKEIIMYFPKLKFKNYLEIFTLIVITVSPLIPIILKLVLVIILIIINIKRIKRINRMQLLVLASFFSIFLIGFVRDLTELNNFSEFSPLNIFYPTCILLGCMIAIKYTEENLLFLIEKITYYIAILSIFGFFLYTYYPSIVNYLPSYNYYHTTHHTAIIFNIINIDGIVVNRNLGIASEPGLYQLLLNIGFYSYIKNNKQISIKKLIVYPLAIITTKSTAGLAIFLFIILYIVLAKNYKIRILVLLVLLIFSPAIFQEISYHYNNKLFGSYAFDTRFEPLLNTIEIAKSNFFGLGNTGYNNYFQGYIQPSYDSFVQVFVRYGYGLLTLISLCLINIFIKDKVFFVILFITFTSQGVWFLPLVSVFYFLYLKNQEIY